MGIGCYQKRNFSIVSYSTFSIPPMMVTIVKRDRKLIDPDDVYTQNAWDNIDWTRDMLEEAEARIQQQKEDSEVSTTSIKEIEPNVLQKWDDFYTAHGDKFFKDRQWIFSEFPELLGFLKEDSPSCRILEVGCGVGNAIAHLVNSNQNQNLHIYGCDLSQNAIDTLLNRDMYQKHRNNLTVFQADVQKDFDLLLKRGVDRESLDFITIIFTLSAFKPEWMKPTIQNLASLLKPGGLILFRDYAIYDLTQLRFKGKAYLGENYYVRADGTTTYFFTKSHVEDLFKSAKLIELELKNDNRLLVNRAKSLKMCRCWIQAKYQK